MKLSMLLFGVAALAAPQGAVAVHPTWDQLDDYSFERFQRDFGKFYESPAEHVRRAKIFETNLAAVRKHNAENHSWRKGVNTFTDMTEEERLQATAGIDRNVFFAEQASRSDVQWTMDDLMESFPCGEVSGKSRDWRHEGVLTPVKNQGNCGSCWAFASTETLEAHWAINTGILVELSEQFILDCTPNPHKCGGTGGCMGGTAKLAYERLEHFGGQPSEWTYPYISGSGANGTCHGTPLAPPAPHSATVEAAANVTGMVSLPTNSYDAIMHVISHVGPLTITVAAGGWHDYESGIFEKTNETDLTLDHLVQLVGYGGGDGDEEPYWIIRNSWTSLWGEKGFMRIRRYPNGDAPCGLDLSPMDGDGCEGSPPNITVCGVSGLLYDGAFPLVVPH